MKMIRFCYHIALTVSILLLVSKPVHARQLNYEFMGHHISLNLSTDFKVPFTDSLNNASIQQFYTHFNELPFKEIVDQLQEFKSIYQLNDWLYYQLVRHTAEALSPKKAHYNRYTLYKWFLMTKSGYDATVSFSEAHLMLYVRSSENIYGIPFFTRDSNQYVCLNYHDFGELDFSKLVLQEVSFKVPEGVYSFSYIFKAMPDFNPQDYNIKDVSFLYKEKEYHFKIKVNPTIQKLFINYPVADFETYFNIPMSVETYLSLIPELRSVVSKMNQKEGVDYLMRFTRYAFPYETDQQNFGKEKRLSPEQTLMYESSDCDDRAGLFFYLVKEIYDLPMIAVLYPTHITIAIQFEKQYGKPIVHNGKLYSVCDPTPQSQDLGVGGLSKHLKNSKFDIVYEYSPIK